MLWNSNSAFLSRFDVYLGRQDNRPEHGLGYNIVMKLTDHIRHTCRCVILATSALVCLFFNVRLLDIGLYACGTVRVNRVGFPHDLKTPRELADRGAFNMVIPTSQPLPGKIRDLSPPFYLNDPHETRDAQRRFGREVVHLFQPAPLRVRL